MIVDPLTAACQAWAKATGIDYKQHAALLHENMRQAIGAYEASKHEQTREKYEQFAARDNHV